MADVEDRLREVFAADAEEAPALPEDVAGGAVRRVRRRRAAWAAGSTAIAGTAAAVLMVTWPTAAPAPSRPAVASRTGPATAPPVVSRTGALPGSATASCVYSPDDVHLREMAIAFDGTVIAIGPADRGARVTFQVHAWFKNGLNAPRPRSGGPTVAHPTDTFGPPSTTGPSTAGPATGGPATITIGMPAQSRTLPNGDFAWSEDPPPAFDIGTRLLVSGEHLFDGTTAADLVGWSCGFTRYYDPAEAARWQRVFG